MIKPFRRPRPLTSAALPWAARRSAAWPVAATFVMTLGAAGLGMAGCDDGDSGSRDSGVDTAPVPQCKAADCAHLMMPRFECTNPDLPVLTFTCARDDDGRCAWTLPRCSGRPEGADGGLSDGGGAIEVGGVDATDAPESIDAPVDAGD